MPHDPSLFPWHRAQSGSPGNLGSRCAGKSGRQSSTRPLSPEPPVTSPASHFLLGRGSWAETSRIAAVLRKETVGGVLLLAGTGIALAWANSPWSEAYTSLRDTRVGPA
ncbi:MAG: Na+/H+ antiporter NhaA, partial [Geodermatophilales bacterium]|nr:Na+/H+ antiporter NhaA [Geodermatophilales bacterium]